MTPVTYHGSFWENLGCSLLCEKLEPLSNNDKFALVIYLKIVVWRLSWFVLSGLYPGNIRLVGSVFTIAYFILAHVIHSITRRMYLWHWSIIYFDPNLVTLLNIPGFIERLCKLATRKVSETAGTSNFLQELEEWYTWLDNALVLDALMHMATEETDQSSSTGAPVSMTIYPVYDNNCTVTCHWCIWWLYFTQASSLHYILSVYP